MGKMHNTLIATDASHKSYQKILSHAILQLLLIPLGFVSSSIHIWNEIRFNQFSWMTAITYATSCTQGKSQFLPLLFRRRPLATSDSEFTKKQLSRLEFSTPACHTDSYRLGFCTNHNAHRQ